MRVSIGNSKRIGTVTYAYHLAREVDGKWVHIPMCHVQLDNGSGFVRVPMKKLKRLDTHA